MCLARRHVLRRLRYSRAPPGMPRRAASSASFGALPSSSCKTVRVRVRGKVRVGVRVGVRAGLGLGLG